MAYSVLIDLGLQYCNLLIQNLSVFLSLLVLLVPYVVKITKMSAQGCAFICNSFHRKQGLFSFLRTVRLCGEHQKIDSVFIIISKQK